MNSNRWTAALAAFALLTACAKEHEPETVVRGACNRAFFTVLEVWRETAELAGQDFPEHCAFLDAEYEIEVVPDASNVSCDGEPLASNELQVGCTRPELKLITLLEQDTVAMTDAAVHEWIHALSDCVVGDYDAGHFRAGLWGRFGPKSVETQAQAAAVKGECL